MGKVLWVDDQPLNNQRERLALSTLGIFVDPYVNNADALLAFKREEYDLIVSDVVREGVSETGWDLATAIRRESKDMPVIFYVGSIDSERERKARQLGATGITTRPDELIKLTLEQLDSRKRSA